MYKNESLSLSPIHVVYCASAKSQLKFTEQTNKTRDISKNFYILYYAEQRNRRKQTLTKAHFKSAFSGDECTNMPGLPENNDQRESDLAIAQSTLSEYDLSHLHPSPFSVGKA